MKPERDNYEIAKVKARNYFLTFSPEEIESRPFISHDGGHYYLSLAGQNCRTDRAGGLVELQSSGGSWQEAGFNAALTVYDLLCWSKPDALPSGEFVSISHLNNVFTSGDNGSFYARFAQKVDRNRAAFADACRKLGGVPAKAPGDLAFLLPLTDFLSVVLQFWESDDEFPAALALLFDSSILSFMHFETVWYAAGHLLDKLEADMG